MIEAQGTDTRYVDGVDILDSMATLTNKIAGRAH